MAWREREVVVVVLCWMASNPVLGTLDDLASYIHSSRTSLQFIFVLVHTRKDSFLSVPFVFCSQAILLHLPSVSPSVRPSVRTASTRSSSTGKAVSRHPSIHPLCRIVVLAIGNISLIEVGSGEEYKELADSETIDGLLRLVSYFGMSVLIGWRRGQGKNHVYRIKKLAAICSTLPYQSPAVRRGE